MAIVLQISSGERISVNSDTVLVGKDRQCQIAFPDAAHLHPVHAKIRKVAGRWLLEAQGGWTIQVGDNSPGKMSWLQAGDVIRLAEAGPVLVFEPASSPSVTGVAAPQLPPEKPPEANAVARSSPRNLASESKPPREKAPSARTSAGTQAMKNVQPVPADVQPGFHAQGSPSKIDAGGPSPLPVAPSSARFSDRSGRAAISAPPMPPLKKQPPPLPEARTTPQPVPAEEPLPAGEAMWTDLANLKVRCRKQGSLALEWNQWSLGAKLIFSAPCAAFVTMFANWVDIGIVSANGFSQGTVLFLGVFVYPLWCVLTNRPLNKVGGNLCAALGLLGAVGYIMSKEVHIFDRTVNAAGLGPYLFILTCVLLIIGVVKYRPFSANDGMPIAE